jgi:hypothetical protein
MLSIGHTKLTSLQYIYEMKEMKGVIDVTSSPITSHILGVFFIKGCGGIITRDSIYNMTYTDTPLNIALTIVNRNLHKGRAGLLACQKQLIDEGLADFAQI